MADNVLSLFIERAEQNKKKPWLFHKDNTSDRGFWKSWLWQDIARDVNALAHYLEQLDLGLEPKIMILSENRPEWLISLYAIWAMGGVAVPVMIGNSLDNLDFIIRNADVSTLIVSNKEVLKQLPTATVNRKIRHVIGFAGDVIQSVPHNARFHYFSQIISGSYKLQFGGRGHQIPLTERARAILPSAVTTLLYTSGTSDKPKGVMLTQAAHLAVIGGLENLFDRIPNFNGKKERFLSFLPLSHCYEFHVVAVIAMNLSARVYFAESVEALRQNMQDVKPTIITAVPRLYQVFYQRVNATIGQKKPTIQKIINKTIMVGIKKALHQPMTAGEKLLNIVLNITVRPILKKIFGGRLKAFISGGAPLDPEIGAFVSSLGVRVLQGYGLTEATIAASVNLPFDERMDSVGPALKGVTIKIADDGEVLLKGATIMTGYWKDPQATRAAIDGEGYLHTGDIGKMENGHLIIVDRKKDIIVNSGGENIAPQRIENMLQRETAIKQAMVFGDKKPYLVALLVIDEELVKSCKGDKKKVREQADLAVGRVNRKLARFEKLRNFMILEEGFSVANQMLSPNMKLRRRAIVAKYQDKINSLY